MTDFFAQTQDVNVKFAMLTGVSRFSKISIFSELNNLKDITLDKRYADICGYNQAELKQSFGMYLNEGQVDLQQLKKWYNGYNFTGTESQKVYNPFDILLFFNKGYRYQNYSFITALGYDTIPEDVTNHGKIDLTVIMRDKIVIVEFKLAKLGDAQSAIQQIKDKKYAEKYVSQHKPVYLIGMSFDSTARNVVDLISEKMP